MALRDYVDEGPLGKRRLPVLAHEGDEEEDGEQVEQDDDLEAADGEVEAEAGEVDVEAFATTEMDID
jgi:hypothetical protein